MTSTAARAPVHPDADCTLDVVTRHSEPLRASLAATGELDLASRDGLAAVLADQLGHGRRYVRIDLTELSFCDCTGLNTLLAAHQDFIAAHGSLVLTGARPAFVRLLKLAALDDVLFVGPAAPT